MTPHDCRGAAPRLLAPTAILEGQAKRRLEIGRTRLLVTGALFVVAFLAVSARLVSLMALQLGAEPRLAAAPAPTSVPMGRADIVDRNGAILATSLSMASLYANPHQILDAADAARKLAGVLTDLSREELAARLSADKAFVWLKRNLTPRQQYAVNRLGIPGLGFQAEEKRFYPLGPLVAHVVGFTDIDNSGLAGIEQSFDDVLQGGREPVRLSLDVRVQQILHDELARAVSEFNGIGGAGIVVDVHTGEVLAMVSLPDFDANLPGSAGEDERFNRATLGVYEMGSTFKIFDLAMALDKGTITLDDSFNATHPLHVAGFTISDYKPKNRWLTVPEIFMYSSNIGAAQIGAEVGGTAQRAFFGRLGMLRPTSIELPELGPPRYPSVWRPINTMTIAYGHGMAVSPINMAAGVAAIVNGGIVRPVTLLKRAPDDVPAGERVVSERTSAQMRQLMRLVVQAGTGRKADVPGYLVGGKTGTADKLRGRGYATNARLASFIGAFPMSAPRYVVLAMIDEPKPNATSHGYATGGWVAAPAVGRLVERMGPMFGLEPIDAQAPEAQNELFVKASATRQAHASE